MAQSPRASNLSGIFHRLVSRADAREALAWFVLVVLAIPPWRAFETEGSVENWELEAWPYAVLGVIALTAVGILVRALGSRHGVFDPGQPGVGGATSQSPDARATWTIIPCLAAYVAVVGQLGFLLVTPLFLTVIMLILGHRHWPIIAAVSIGIPVIPVVVVVGLCDLVLPPGVGLFADFSAALIGMSG